jgi:hypothetical protein
MRLATLLAAMRRGWVWPINLPRGARPGSELPRPMAKAIFGVVTHDDRAPSPSAILGNWVVLPEPVSPQTMMTWCAAMAAMISSRLPDTGSDSGNSICSICRLRQGALQLRRESWIIPALSHSDNAFRNPGELSAPMSHPTVFNFTFVPWFRSVAPYIHKFRNQTFVVGIAGEAIAAGKLPIWRKTWP